MVLLGVLVALVIDASLVASASFPALLDRVDLPEGGYVAWRISGPSGAHVDVRAHNELDSGTVSSTAAWLTKVNATSPLSVGSMSSWPGEIRAHVSTASTGQLVDLNVFGNKQGGATEADVVGSLSGGEEWLALGLAGADGQQHGYVELYADSGVIVLGRSNGPSFEYRVPSFEGDSIWLKTTASVRFIDNASKTIPVSGRLFSLFLAGTETGDLQLSIQGPSRQWSGDQGYVVSNEGVGLYRFTIDRWHDTSYPCFGGSLVLLCDPIDLRLFGADVRLP